jgi:hypothetical protein
MLMGSPLRDDAPAGAGVVGTEEARAGPADTPASGRTADEDGMGASLRPVFRAFAAAIPPREGG